MAMGTDAGTPGNHCGDNMQEVEIMVDKAGFPPADAIHAATMGAADMMGLAGNLGGFASRPVRLWSKTRLAPV
jgi:imidazolonepropionase-like amidohydrolase